MLRYGLSTEVGPTLTCSCLAFMVTRAQFLLKKPPIFWHNNKHIDLADECLNRFFKSLNFKHIGEFYPCAPFVYLS